MSASERAGRANAERAERQAERRREAERRAERRRRIEALLGEGLSQREVARKVGCSPSVVNAVVHNDRPRRPEQLVDWPPAEPGNTRAMTHGLESDRVTKGVIEPRARELAPGIVEVHPHLDDRRDGPAVLRLAMTYARLERAYDWLAEQPDDLFSDRTAGKVHGLLGRVERWEASARAAEADLGISPATRTRLKLDQARHGALLRGQRLDYSRLSDDKLAQLRALLEEAAAIEGDATETKEGS